MRNTEVNIAGVSFKNPVTTASGTFGSGEEYSEFVDLSHSVCLPDSYLGGVPTSAGRNIIIR